MRRALIAIPLLLAACSPSPAPSGDLRAEIPLAEVPLAEVAPVSSGWGPGDLVWVSPDALVASSPDERLLSIGSEGGARWSAPARSLPDGAYLAPRFVDAMRGFTLTIVRERDQRVYTFHTSANAGAEWTSREVGRLPGVGGGGVLGEIWFADAGRGVILATTREADANAGTPGAPVACRVFVTDDGGAGWSESAGAGPCLGAGSFRTADGLGFVRDGMGGWVSADRWRTWSRTEGLGGALIEGALVRGEDGLYAAVVDRPLNGPLDPSAPLRIVRSPDAGASWEPAYEASGIAGLEVAAIAPIDARTWFAAVIGRDPEMLGGTGLYQTLDAGRTWTAIRRIPISSGGRMHWLDARHGTLQGTPLGGGNGAWWYTADGGATWASPLIAAPAD